ncbi:MerR family transcriptional regulator [Streptomyces sp. MBT65]|uniref:MerR family transcriptional regulator n=1 Tax=Streptomyces sp. MBT65 TaxID=1488395 RepID=UPI00190D80AA|nr:MerR family transcriptional regulator [Streptomyces sp. MBT65]MBK3580207.1 MerR family transcriptional regulator [Streptomyces sp. MBT65]
MDDPVSAPRRGPLRTADVARESGYSVQQVRDLERLGVIPPATRSSNGYRSYTPLHLHALRAYRGLAGAVGPVAARQLLAELLTGTITEAASAINEVHVRLARERAEALRAQEALRAIQSEADTPEFEQESAQDSDAMTITELSRALGVRPSTLRFWEQEGLVSPERVTSLRARRYDLSAIRAARIVTALRSTGYGISAVREIVGSLYQLDGTEEARRVLRERLDDIALRTVGLLRAGTDLAAVVMAAEESSAAPPPKPPCGSSPAEKAVADPIPVMNDLGP